MTGSKDRTRFLFLVWMLSSIALILGSIARKVDWLMKEHYATARTYYPDDPNGLTLTDIDSLRHTARND